MLKTSCAQLIIGSLVLLMSLMSIYAQSGSGDSEPTHAPPPLPPPPLPPPPPPPPHSSGLMPGATPPTATPQNIKSRREDEKHNRDTEEIKKILTLTLPLIGVMALVLLAVGGIWYMLRQARYGAFCCLKANLSYHHVDESYKDEQDENEDDLAPPSSGIPPPDYSPTTIGPPVYEDALQDVILSSGTVGVEYLQPTSSGLTNSTTTPVTTAPVAPAATAVATVTTAVATVATSPPYSQLTVAATSSQMMPTQKNYAGVRPGENGTGNINMDFEMAEDTDSVHEDVSKISYGVQQI